MCGICGYDTQKNVSPLNLRLNQNLFKNMLALTQSRGKDATGYMAHYRKKSESIYKKLPLRATEFIKRGFVELRVPPTTIVGHTRAATRGDAAININNHPFIGAKYGVVHNGTIANYSDKKYDWLRNKCESDCDSELFLKYIDANRSLRKIRVFFNSASFALVYMDLSTGVLIILRDNTYPLAIAHLIELQSYIFASTAEIIKSAVRLTFKRFPEYEIREFANNHLYVIDSASVTKKQKLQEPPKAATPTSYSTGSYNTGARYNGSGATSRSYIATATGDFTKQLDGKWSLKRVRNRFTNLFVEPKSPSAKTLIDYEQESRAWEELLERLFDLDESDDVLQAVWDEAEQCLIAKNDYEEYKEYFTSEEDSISYEQYRNLKIGNK